MKKEDCKVGLKVKMIKRSAFGRRASDEQAITGVVLKIYERYALVRVYTGTKNSGYNETFRFQELTQELTEAE